MNCRPTKQQYNSYLQSPHWLEMKRKYKNSYCQICKSTKDLHLHHWTYKNLGNETEKDFFTLCKFCHLASHISLTSRKHLLNPSAAATRITKKIINGNRIKRDQICLFFRRCYISHFDTEVPEFERFRLFAYRYAKYIDGKPWYQIPSDFYFRLSSVGSLTRKSLYKKNYKKHFPKKKTVIQNNPYKGLQKKYGSFWRAALKQLENRMGARS